MSHGDKVDAIPEGFRVVATSDNAPHAAIANDEPPLLRRTVPPGSRPHARWRGAVA